MEILKRIAGFHTYLRYWFWKAVTGLFGGTIGRGTAFYENTKVFMTSKSSLLIGENCIFQQGSILSAADAEIKIGNRVYIGEYAVISAKGSVEIGDNAILATHTFVVDFNHDFDDAGQSLYDRFTVQKVKIGRDVWIGAGCKILKGVTIGDGCVVGAGSVVTRDLPPYSVCSGVPARVMRYRKSAP